MDSSPARPVDPRTIAIELAATGLVVGALTIGLVGFHVKDVSGGYELVTRFWDVLAAVIVAMIGRAWLIALREGAPWLVAATATPLTVALIAALDLPELNDALLWLVPFKSNVLQWIMAAVALGFSIVGIVRMVRARSARPARGSGGAEPAQGAGAAAGAGANGGVRTSFIHESTPWISSAFLLLALLLPFVPGMNLSTLDIAVLVLTYVMLGWGLNIVVGLAGLLDLGYVAFYAVGAYSFALFASPDSPILKLMGATEGISFWYALPIAGLMAALAGVLLGFPVLRLRGDYLAIVTLGFGEIIRKVIENFVSLTRGPDGISNIPPPGILGHSTKPVMDNNTLENTTEFHTWMGWKFDQYDNTILLYYVILAMALLTNWFTVRIRKLPVGRAWEALREDEIACKSLGINPVNTKLTAFALGAMFGGFAGSFFAARQTFISPESFTFIESAVILAIVVLGGFGSQLGVVVAAFLLIGLPELFRELKDFRMLFFGASMVLIMLWRPAGLLAHRDPTIRFFGTGPPGGGDAGGVLGGAAAVALRFACGLGAILAGVLCCLAVLGVAPPAGGWIILAGMFAGLAGVHLAMSQRDGGCGGLVAAVIGSAAVAAALMAVSGFRMSGSLISLSGLDVAGWAAVAAAALGLFALLRLGRFLWRRHAQEGRSLWRQVGGALMGAGAILLLSVAGLTLAALADLAGMLTLRSLFGIAGSVLLILGFFVMVIAWALIGLALWRIRGAPHGGIRRGDINVREREAPTGAAQTGAEIATGDRRP